MVVSKYRLYYYLGMARPTGQEAPATEEVAGYTHRSAEKGTGLAMGGDAGGHQGLPRGEGQRGRALARAFIVVFKGRSGEGGQAGWIV